ncbi:MAG: hypothetical protein K2X03_25890 [Bryobacteraceae bacterium]|nr:hypothetical protein [Bryobacteraceae bacterium]
MARGWESKDIESQQELREAERLPARAISERERQLQSLELTRVRVAADLARATHPRHRMLVEDALAHLDAQIAALR